MCNKDLKISNNSCNHIEELLECTKRNVEYKCEILFMMFVVNICFHNLDVYNL